MMSFKWVYTILLFFSSISFCKYAIFNFYPHGTNYNFKLKPEMLTLCYDGLLFFAQIYTYMPVARFPMRHTTKHRSKLTCNNQKLKRKILWFNFFYNTLISKSYRLHVEKTHVEWKFQQKIMTGVPQSWYETINNEINRRILLKWKLTIK